MSLSGCSLFSSADPIKKLRSYVNQEIEDSDRRTRLLAEIDVFEDRIRTFETKNRGLSQEMLAANADYDIAPQAIAERLYVTRSETATESSVSTSPGA